MFQFKNFNSFGSSLAFDILECFTVNPLCSPEKIMSSMKALELIKYEKFEYKDVPVPEIAPNEVLVRVAACGICGSDVHGMDGSSGRRIPPIIMGHEASGTIFKVGEAVDGSKWKEGDRVTFDSMISCGNCWYCNRAEINLCEDRMVLGVSCGD